MFLCFYEIYSTYYNKFGQEHRKCSITTRLAFDFVL